MPLRTFARTTCFQTFQACSNWWSSPVRLTHFKTVSGRTGPGCCQQRFCLEWPDTFSVSRHHVVLALSEKHCAVNASESRQRRSSQRMDAFSDACEAQSWPDWELCIQREVYKKPNYINQSASSTFHSPKNFWSLIVHNEISVDSKRMEILFSSSQISRLEENKS